MSISAQHYTSSGVPVSFWFVVTKADRDALATAVLRSNGPAWQLLRMLGPFNYCLYSLRWHHLFLTKADAAKHLIHDHKTIAKWEAAVRKHIKPPYFFCIEVGRKGEIHAHVVAGHWAGMPMQQRNHKTNIVKMISNTDADKHRVISYMFKVAVPLTEEHDDIKAPLLSDWEERVLDYELACFEQGGESNLPNLRGFVL